MRVGAHVSISDGLPDAVETEADLGGTAGQIFVGSPRGWAVSSFDESEAQAFEAASADHDVGPWLVHGTYLINLATPKDDLGAKSVDTLQGELDACAQLGIPYLVFHPGSHTGAGVDQGLQNVADRLSELTIPDGVTLLLENMSGKGTQLGRDFAELDAMVQRSEHDYGPLGVCLDTCHLFSAGLDFRTADALDDLVADLDAEIGLENVHYLHLNDSKHPFGEEKDEHEHIGEGEIGADPFELFVNHDALREKPMVLETPVDDDRGYAWNIDRVRDLRH